MNNNSQTLRQKIYQELRTSLKLSIPLILSEVIYGLSGFTSTAMAAHLGSKALAANALVWVVFITLIVFFIGVLCAVSILVAHSYGANDQKGIQTATRQGLLLSVVLAVPMILVVFMAPHILSFTGQNREVIRLATPYFYSLVWCMIPLNFVFTLEQFLMGIAKTRLVLLISIFIVPIQMLFFYLFVFGAFGFPKCGLPGFGYGYAVAYVITAVAIGLYVHYSKSCREYKIFASRFRWNGKYFKEMLRVGIPMGSMYCIELALFAAIAILMGRLGPDVLAAHQIAYQCLCFSVSALFGLSQTVSIRVGHEVGRNSRESIVLATWVNLSLGLCWMGIFGFLYLGFPKWLISIDLNIHTAEHQQVVHYAIQFLAAAAILQIVDCFRIIGAGALRGLKDTGVPLWISVIGFWCVAFPCAYILGFTYSLGGIGLWSGMIFGLAVSSLIILIRFYRLYRTLDLRALVMRET